MESSSPEVKPRMHCLSVAQIRVQQRGDQTLSGFFLCAFTVPIPNYLGTSRHGTAPTTIMYFQFSKLLRLNILAKFGLTFERGS